MARRPMPPPPDRAAAAAEAEESRRWSCASCGAPIDPAAQEYPGYCWPCGSYYEDVANGLWEENE